MVIQTITKGSQRGEQFLEDVQFHNKIYDKTLRRLNKTLKKYTFT